MSKHYDLIAIGAGSGGLSVAERVALYGKRCAVVESGPLGGTCVNVGCVPKKVMWFGAGLAHALDDAAGYGFTVHGHDFDWAQLKSARDRYVGGINDWYGNYLADSGIDLLRGTARLVDARKDGRWTYFRLADEQRTPEAREAAALVCRALAKDDQARADRVRLKQLLKVNPEELSRQQSECKC